MTQPDTCSPTLRRVVARLTTLLGATLLATIAAAGQGQGPADDSRTILDRVFSVAQADRGEARFKQSCGGCHTATQFAEPAFSARWEGQSLGDVFEFMVAAMPENDPGGLAPEEYANVLAFFLGQSGYPVGYDDLPADAAVLRKIGIVPQPK